MALGLFGGTTIQRRFDRTNTIPPDPVHNGLASKRTPRSPKGGARMSRSSPIPPDPVYGAAKVTTDMQPPPRIKPEALNIARNHQGAALASLFNPQFKVIPVGTRQGCQTPKDFGRENFRKIMQIQRVNKEKAEVSQRSEPMKAVHKPGKYDHIGSKVAENIKSPPAAPRPKSANYKFSESNVKEDRGRTDRPATATGRTSRPTTANPVVPRLENIRGRRSSSVDREVRRTCNYVKENIMKASKSQLKRSPSTSALDDLKKKKEDEFKSYQRGSVPKYLQERQQQWKREEEIRKANEPDPSIPVGHSLLPEAERRTTIDLLKKSQEEMLTELRSLPVSKDTVRVKQRRESLEKKLQEVETAMKIFSRPRVFVKNE